MHTFRVWAPNAGKVEVQVGRKLFPMQPDRNGWWLGAVAAAGPGSDYGYLLDGEGPYPDPRSAWQPAGVHGLSRVADPVAFEWSDAGFQAPPLSGGIVYELHLGTFTSEGTLDAAIAKLDHLVQLGITHVELMPVNAFPGRHGWGYDGVGLFAVHEPYGGPEALRRFVNAAHHRGLAVLLDVVYNHLGPSGNYLARFAPYFNSRYHTVWGPALNFDGPDSDEVRRFFCDNARMWLRDYHLDGLRLDAVHAILDTSAEPFLEQLSREVKVLEAELRRQLVLIAESDLNDPRLLRSRDQGGYDLRAQWSDDFHHSLHSVLTGERSGYYEDFGAISDLAKAFSNAFVYDSRYSAHRRRHHGRPRGDLSGHRFLAYLQNHDQIGNRARGERMSQLVDLDRLKIGAALVLTSPFIPMLFMGEEWGASTPFQYFTDHQDTDLAESISQGRCNEFAAFGWNPQDVPDPQDPQTFQRSKLNWTELKTPPHAELLEWHRRLIQLRKSEPALTNGRLDECRVDFDEAARWLKIERGGLTVLCNFGPDQQHIPVSGGEHTILLSTAPVPPPANGVGTLPPKTLAICRLESDQCSESDNSDSDSDSDSGRNTPHCESC